MTVVPHEPSKLGQGQRSLWPQLLVRELWASLAISVMWLAVLFDALFGPEIDATSAAGDTASVPSAVVVALFAFLGTWVVAHYGLRQRED